MPKFNKIVTGDKLLKTKSGAWRSTNEGKGRFDLIPIWPLFRLASHYEKGAQKYLPRNWEKGMPLSRYYDSAMRHLVKYMGGDKSEDHLAAVAWNVFAIMDHEERIERGLLDPSLNDMPPTIFLPKEFEEKKVKKKRK